MFGSYVQLDLPAERNTARNAMTMFDPPVEQHSALGLWTAQDYRHVNLGRAARCPLARETRRLITRATLLAARAIEKTRYPQTGGAGEQEHSSSEADDVCFFFSGEALTPTPTHNATQARCGLNGQQSKIAMRAHAMLA